MTNTKCCRGGALVGFRWSKVDASRIFHRGLAVRVGRLQRVSLDQLSRWGDHAKYANHADGHGRCRRTPSMNPRDFCHCRHFDRLASCFHLVRGDEPARIGPGNFVQLLNRNLRYGSARFADGHRSSQRVTAELRGIRVVVNNVAPGRLRVHLEQSRLGIDTLLRFFPPPPDRRHHGPVRVGEQHAGNRCIAKSSWGRSDRFATQVRASDGSGCNKIPRASSKRSGNQFRGPLLVLLSIHGDPG